MVGWFGVGFVRVSYVCLLGSVCCVCWFRLGCDVYLLVAVRLFDCGLLIYVDVICDFMLVL